MGSTKYPSHRRGQIGHRILPLIYLIVLLLASSVTSARAATIPPTPEQGTDDPPAGIQSPAFSSQDTQTGTLAFLPIIATPAGLSTLPLTFPVMSPALVAYFNNIARQGDIATVPSSTLNMLQHVDAGQRKVGFASWAQAQQVLPEILDQIDIIAYNPEHWDLTPAYEQQNLPAVAIQAAEYAHHNGKIFMFSPDIQFATEHLAEVALYADLIGLQGQRLQDDPEFFASRMSSLIAIARASNPQAEIFVQVGTTQGPADQMLTAIQTIDNQIDGISVWTSTDTLATLEEFINLIRGN